MLKTVSIIVGLAACGSGSSHHLADSNGRDTSGGSDSGVVYPCSLQVASSLVTGDTNATERAAHDDRNVLIARATIL